MSMSRESMPQVDLQLGLSGTTLFASLRDQAGAFLIGETPDAIVRMEQVAALWRAPLWDAEAPDHLMEPTGLPTRHFRAIGEKLFDSLLPHRIQSYFQECSGCELRLTVDHTLAGVPWECTFDGQGHWQSIHKVTRRLSAHALPAALQSSIAQMHHYRVLLVGEGSIGSPSHSYLRDLQEYLESVSILTVRSVDPLVMAPVADTQEDPADIVHWVGSESLGLANLVANPTLMLQIRSARFVILDWVDDDPHAVAWAGAGAALDALLNKQPNLLAIQRPGRRHGNVDTAHQLYQSLQWGKRTPGAPGVSMNDHGVVSTYSESLWSMLFDNPGGGAERSFRLVTALSYDLVKSTRLMQSLGLERYSLKLDECHRRFASLIEEWGGDCGKPQGNDGVMSFFGARRIRENAVSDAIRATQKLHEMAASMRVAIRTGIATGEAAVTNHYVVGLCVHLAARIQKISRVGSIQVNAVARRLADPAFAFRRVDARRLNGFSEKPEIWQLVAWQVSPGQPPMVPTAPVRLFGRDHELDELMAQWRIVRQGQARWVHVTGEAGIGKSRLVSAFAQTVGKEFDSLVFVLRCDVDSTGKPFGPLIGMFEQLFGFQSTDTATRRAEKFAEAMQQYAVRPDDRMALGYMLGVERQDAMQAMVVAAQETRRVFVMRTMTSWLIDQARTQPVCLIVEDIQWVDPSTQEYLHRIRAECQDKSIMVAVTERIDAPQSEPCSLTERELRLGRLDDRSVRSMIAALAPNHAMSRVLEDSIVQRSDGVPLFVEMSTRMVLEKLELYKADVLQASMDEQSIPYTLRGLLTNRLDSLGPSRHLARLCSCIGREFPRQLLVALRSANVIQMTAERLDTQLAELLASGLLLESDKAHPETITYRFRHALVHEVAYQSNWEIDRKAIHLAIAQALEHRMADTAAALPELVAHHFEAAGASEDGVRWHRLAARKFKAAEAHAESLVHLAAARRLVQALPSNPQRTRLELDIELTTAGQMIATRGYGSEGAGQSYLAALMLGKVLGDKKSILRAQLGLEAYHLMRADFELAHAYLASARETALQINDPLANAQCLFALANVLHHQGYAREMQEVSAECLEACRQIPREAHLVQSTEVMCRMYAAVCMWETGQVEQALLHAQEGVDAARRIGQRLSLGQALGMQSMVLLWCGEFVRASQISEQAVQVCQAGGHDMWTAHAQMIHGSCTAELGGVAEGIAEMDAAYATVGIHGDHRDPQLLPGVAGVCLLRCRAVQDRTRPHRPGPDARAGPWRALLRARDFADQCRVAVPASR